MMEGIDSSIDSLMEEHVVEIVGSSFEINIAKPHGTASDDGDEIGSKVKIVKRGEIIPHIEGLADE